MRTSPPPEAATELGRQLRNHRMQAGRRMIDVATTAGMDEAQLSKLECGEAGDSRISTFARVAHALGLEVGVIQRGEVPNEATTRAA